MATNYDAHPLFPARNDNEEPPEVLRISIHRQENGRLTFAGTFSADEIQDEQFIVDRWGGGTYELTARNRTAITDKRGINLAGPSKPLYQGPPPDQNAPPAAPNPPPATQAATQAPGAPSWLPVAAAFMPLLLQWIQGQQEAARSDRAAQQAMIAAMMQASQASNQQMVTLLTTMNRPQGGNGEDFRKGMDFMSELLAAQLERANEQKKEGDESEMLMQTIAQLSKGLEFIQGLSGAADSPPPPPPPPEGT